MNPWSLVACIAEIAEQLPFSYLCKTVVDFFLKYDERERALNGEDRIVKIQELVYNRPNLIRSQAGSVSTFGCMLQFRIFFFFFFPTYVCIQLVQAKSKNEQCQCAFRDHSSARKRERECYNYVCAQFSVGLCQCIHICVHMYVLVCVCVHQGVHICVTVGMCRRGVGVSCVLVCRRP